MLAPEGALTRHYLIDFNYQFDPETRFATMGHLVVFNPGSTAAEMRLKAIFEEGEPRSWSMVVKGNRCQETNFEGWPVQPGERFALVIDSDQPVVCQATVGWNNTANRMETVEGCEQREAAKSYLSLRTLARCWCVADGLVLDLDGKVYINETEELLLLNPGDESLSARVETQMEGRVSEFTVEVEARRLKVVKMQGRVKSNRHYGVVVSSSEPMAAQWLRYVEHVREPGLMTFWSVPCLALDPEPQRES